MNRRQFLKASAGVAALAATAKRAHAAFYQSPNLAKFIQPLRGIGGTGIPVATSDGTRVWFKRLDNTYGVVTPPATPPAGATVKATATHYTIEIKEFTDTLYPNLVNGNAFQTKLWGFNPAGVATPRHLGGIIAVRKDTPVQITFRNMLPTTAIIPVDNTIMGADRFPHNRAAVHAHGGYVPWVTDGGPFGWFAPDGTHGASFLNNAVLRPGEVVPNGEGEYYYPNNQSARLLWYHDHAWGITRLNAYAGIASGYVIFDDFETITLAAFGLPGPLDPKTIYLVFQDKNFVDSTTIGVLDPTWTGPTVTGSLWYAHTYDPARWELGPAALPLPDPSVVPEFFGDTILVNGTVYPFLELQQRQYRFRLLNACNARFLNPRLVFAASNVLTSVGSTEPPRYNIPPGGGAVAGAGLGPPFLQIGTEGGFLPFPTLVNGPKQPVLLLGPAERADVIVDLRAVPVGSVFILYNDAPAPFPGGDGRYDYFPGNPKTPTSIPGAGPNTRTLLQIRVVAGATPEPTITLPASLLAGIDPLLVAQTPGVPIVPVVNAVTGTATVPGLATPVTFRQLTLNEAFDAQGRLIQFLGTNVPLNPGAKALTFGREYTIQATEIVPKDAIEIWEIANLTGDTHPIHFHLVNVQVLSRQVIGKNYAGIPNYQGASVAPDTNELGWKETVRMNPGEVTRVIMKFTLPAVPFTVPASPRAGAGTFLEPGLGTIPGGTANEYVWHCHILEHEEHDMMRPLVVVGDNPTL